MKRILAVIGVAVGLAFSAGASAHGGHDNVVLADATQDNAVVLQAKTQLAKAKGDTVDNANFARATASNCTGCYASAVAVQVVFVEGSPSEFTPQNVSLAVNNNCNTCGSYAYAWQYVIQAEDKLSHEAKKQVAGLGRQISDLVTSTRPTDKATDDDLTAKLNELTAQIKQTVKSDLQSQGEGDFNSDTNQQVRESEK
jgi:hypothetical protein